MSKSKVSPYLAKVPVALFQGNQYAFSPEVNAALKGRFPHITDKIIAGLANRIGSFRDMNEMFDSFVPEHLPTANDGVTGREIRGILAKTEELLAKTEELQQLMQNANSRTTYLLEQASGEQNYVPFGAELQRHPTFDDARTILIFWAQGIKSSSTISNLLRTGKGRRPGGADVAPYSILNLLNEVMCRNFPIDNDENFEVMERADIKALAEILKIHITESYIKQWRKEATG